MLAAAMAAVFTTPTASATDPYGFPFLLGTAKGPDNKAEPLLTYEIGSNPGTILLDNTMPDLSLESVFAQFDTYPDSDHPDGTAFFWIFDDAEAVYFIVDWTSDDTDDEGDDFFSVHICDSGGLKTYTQHTEPVSGSYGVSMFIVTDRADYEHMCYIIAVPKTDLCDNIINVGFELYGTAATFVDLYWAGVPPDTATVNTPVDFSITYEMVYMGNFPFGEQMALLIEYDTAANLNDLLDNWWKWDYDGDFFTDNMVGRDYRSPAGIQALSSVVFTPTSIYDGTVTSASSPVTISTTFTASGTHNVAILAFRGSSDSYGPCYWMWNPNVVVTTVNVTGGAAFVPVTNITGVPSSATAGTPLTLNGTVVPSNADNKTIVWTVENAGTTGAAIAGNTLSTADTGTVVVRATIVNGAGAGVDYTKDFTINVKDPHVPVTGITGVPSSAKAGTPLALKGQISPSNADGKKITWTVKSTGSTGAYISSNSLYTTNGGTVVITATVADGKAPGVPYTKDFTITVSSSSATTPDTGGTDTGGGEKTYPNAWIWLAVFGVVAVGLVIGVAVLSAGKGK
jgi:hypothetical protein